ncbi:hypothetical protein [Paenibacillus sp. FSL R5-0810]|uniref:hypothetical protein n=1 Tax=Paenibacillus sp. FSL R5-0810 TaxID=2921659 RepID=UPI0030F8602A
MTNQEKLDTALDEADRVSTIDPGDRDWQKDMEWAQIIWDAGEYQAWTEPLIYWLQEVKDLQSKLRTANEEIARINSKYYADRQRFYDRGRQLARYEGSLDWLKQRFEEEWNFELGIGEVVEEIIYRFEGGGEPDAG